MNDLHREAFREEAYETLGLLETALLELEDEPDNGDLVGRVFRYMHTIKGSGAMFGFDDIASFTHEIETVFDLVRSGKIAVSRELINLTLRARDCIRLMLDGPDSAEALQRSEPEAVAESFRRLLPSNCDQAPSNPVPAAPAPQIPAPKGSLGGLLAYRIRFSPGNGAFLAGTNPVLLIKELGKLGSLTVTVNTDHIPALEEIDPEHCFTSWDMVLVSGCDMAQVQDVFVFVDQDELSVQLIEEWDEDGHDKRLGEILVERGDLDPQQLEEVLGARKKLGEMLVESGLVPRHLVESALVEQQQIKEIHKARSSQEKQGSIRVPSERLDHLVNLVGEQVTVQARLSQLALSEQIPELALIAEEVARLTADLRESTLKIRMLPIGATFNNFRRLVRDLSLELGKEVEMTTAGEETELDKTVIEKLNDPLVHMIRNCIDHAIELPELRIARGKPRQGKVHLAALHSGDSVYITIKDDGAGLNREAIFAKAIEKDLVSAEAQLTDKEIFALIFAPGFSTAQAVTSVSGRGVGMDVVKRSIEELRGSIDIKSEQGAGTVITVRIPLTLAIIESLLVEIGMDHFLFPLSQVEECMFLTDADVAKAHGRQVVSVRDRIIPYIRLRSRFALSGAPSQFEQLVITDVDGEKIGFVVDNIVGQHQTVIKALGSAYQDVEGISGATILGDGSVGLILDVPKLYHAEQEADQA